MSMLLPSDSWIVDDGITDAVRFFELLPTIFPRATLLCVEGCSIAPAVLSIYNAHRSAGRNPARRQTLFPISKFIACTFSAALASNLSEAASDHANPDLLDHLSLFEDSRCVLEWHDAFANVVVVEKNVSEGTIADLASTFGVRYERSAGTQ